MNIICKQQYVREDNEKNMLKNKMTIEHMNLHYGDFHALKDINLNIKENQITAFIGLCFCGKIRAPEIRTPSPFFITGSVFTQIFRSSPEASTSSSFF